MAVKLAYKAAGGSRLLSGMNGSVDINSDIKHGLDRVRMRAREAFQNDALLARYENAIIENVIGHKGIETMVAGMFPDGTLDANGNAIIQSRFDAWMETAMANNESWLNCQNCTMQTVPRDGEVLLRFIRERTGLKLQLLPADHLDINHNDILSNGNRVVSGVEVNDFGAHIAYHIWQQNPNDRLMKSPKYNKRLRIPVADMMLINLPTHPNQIRGMPWVTTVLADIYHLAEYIKTELINARVAASKGIFLTKPIGESTNDDPLAKKQAKEDGYYKSEVEPGSIESLPDGWTYNAFNPSNPGERFDPFVTRIMKRIASGLSVSYATISGDVSDANYSSMRAGALIERATYKRIQQWMIDKVCKRVYLEWLRVELLTGNSNIPMSKYFKFSRVKFVPRNFPFVDPAKDLQAIEQELTLGLTTEIQLCAERGLNYEDILKERAEVRRLQAKYGEISNVE